MSFFTWVKQRNTRLQNSQNDVFLSFHFPSAPLFTIHSIVLYSRKIRGALVFQFPFDRISESWRKKVRPNPNTSHILHFCLSWGTNLFILQGIKRRGCSHCSFEVVSGICVQYSFLQLSFGNREVQTNFLRTDTNDINMSEYDVEALNRHLAAIRLQKTYKSFRTRRQLADCAVLVEQRWWKLLDFAELKRTSVSFFDIRKPETAVSRWSRARTKAAKVGKGLSKDERACKLALQHWLEAIDPRHRYGHNLQFYYTNWLHADSKQPFFYWLDIGEGKATNLEKCSRLKLHQQCIKYLGPTEREAYEVHITDGKLIYKQTGKPLDTREGPEDTKWIFVLSVLKIMYAGMKRKGTFQHSSFLAGGTTLSAGRLSVEDGVLKAVWPHSGHYLPTEENFQEFMDFLVTNNVDLSVVQRKAPNNEDEVSFPLRHSTSVPTNLNFNRANTKSRKEREKKERSGKKYHSDAEDTDNLMSRWSSKLKSKIALLQIPKRDDMDEFDTPKLGPLESPNDGYETADEDLSDLEDVSDSELSVSKENLFDKDDEDEYEEPIPRENIMKRINSHKGLKSYQLANQLSCKWTTGAGPRIGCVRDYPLELQIRVLEDVSLTPKSSHLGRRSSRLGSFTIPTPPKKTSQERSALGSNALQTTGTVISEEQSI